MQRTKVIVDRSLYSLDAIKKAFYVFKQHHISEIVVIDDSAVAIYFNLPDTTDDDKNNQILMSFQHELVDQSLREKVNKETEFARNLILANAFSNAPIGEET